MDARFYFIFAKQVLYKGLTIKLVNPGLFLYYFTQNFTITIGFTIIQWKFDCFRKSIYATQSCLLESKPVKLETSYLYNDPYHYDKERILCSRTRLTCQLIQLLNVPTRARIQNYILFWHWALCSEIIIIRYPSVST